MYAVLQELASAVARSIRPLAPAGYSLSLVKTLPSTFTLVGQSTGDDGVTPRLSSASEETVLNVEPGAKRPYVASLYPLLPGPLAAARIAPVDGLMATSALAGPTVLRMCSASGLQPRVERQPQRLARLRRPA